MTLKKAAPSEWVFVRRAGPFYVSEPEPMRPDVLVVLDTATGLIPDTQVVAPGTSALEAAEWAATALGKRVRGIHPPCRLRVEGEELAAAVRSLVGHRMPVVAGAAPEADEALEAMKEAFARASDDDELRSHLEAPGLTEEAALRFFEAAAGLFRLAPWKFAHDSQAIRIDAPALGHEGACACIIGALGESLGVIVYQSLADYVAFSRIAEDTVQERARRRGPGVAMFSINFEDKSDVPAALWREARSRGWPVAGPRAFPAILALDPDGLARPLTGADYAFATACVEALATFVKKHRALFQTADPRPVSEEYVIRGLKGAPRVRITAPHPDADWTWGRETATDAMHWRDADVQLQAFAGALRAQGRPPDWVEAAVSQVAQILALRVEGGQAAEPWKARDVREYLLEFFPEHVMAADDEIDLVPDYLLWYFEWLGASGRQPPSVVVPVREEIERRRKAFAQAARDRSRWAPAKVVAIELRHAGVDPRDEKAVARFVAELQRRAPKDPSVRPDLFPPPSAGPRRQKSFVWMGDTPAPDPKGPCPCGSGKAYKKCCRPH